jgi:hypothetical protein
MNKKAKLVLLRIDDLELYRALKILSREPKYLGYTDRRGSVSGVIMKFVLMKNAALVKEKAASAVGGPPSWARPTSTSSAFSVSRHKSKKPK